MPTSFSSTLTRMRSVKLPFSNHHHQQHKRKSVIPETMTTTAPECIATVINPTTTTHPISVTSPTLAETLEAINKEVYRTQFDDVFDSFFFTDKRCQHRALFMACRLQQALDTHPLIRSKSLQQTGVNSFWRLVTHRLYTLNYILFVLPTESTTRAGFLGRIEADLERQSDGLELTRRGGMEAHFAVRYALNHRRRRRKTLLEDAFRAEEEAKRREKGETIQNRDDQELDLVVAEARAVIEQCLESESSLGQHSERDAMYVFHSMRTGFLDAFQPHIELEEDRGLRHRLRRMVEYNQCQQQEVYENPFEDEDLIVSEEEDNSSASSSSSGSSDNDMNKSRGVDSGFYDGWVNMNK
ncbi:MAG: hypothetical protein EXX96DRAFT_546505 [Benjaminiella poitrasii]|nr:MAG: hypothetical protein EXX96DRAFT_546505 [Benjaminiella poitrasii]